MIIQKLKQTKDLTSQEQEIVNYILKNPDCILENNAKELATLTYTSSSTVIRLCQKLGYKGYPDFQLQYIKNHVTKDQFLPTINTEHIFTKEAVDIANNVYQYVLHETRELMNKDTLVRIVNYMQKAKRIDFYAGHINFFRVQTACLKLSSINIQAQAFNAINQSYVKTTNPEECLSFVVSHSGNNPALLEIAYTLRKHNMKTIAITSSTEPALELICNESLYMFSSNSKFHAIEYGLSLEYIIDILCICLMKEAIK